MTDDEQRQRDRAAALDHYGKSVGRHFVSPVEAFCDGRAHARRESAERRSAIAHAVELVAKYTGCGDNSCLFSKPTGPGTNGGCQCIKLARPFVAAALAKLYRDARGLLAGAEPARTEAPLVSQKLKSTKCGAVWYGSWVRDDADRLPCFSCKYDDCEAVLLRGQS